MSSVPQVTALTSGQGLPVRWDSCCQIQGVLDEWNKPQSWSAKACPVLDFSSFPLQASWICESLLSPSFPETMSFHSDFIYPSSVTPGNPILDCRLWLSVIFIGNWRRNAVRKELLSLMPPCSWALRKWWPYFLFSFCICSNKMKTNKNLNILKFWICWNSFPVSAIITLARFVSWHWVLAPVLLCSVIYVIPFDAHSLPCCKFREKGGRLYQINQVCWARPQESLVLLSAFFQTCSAITCFL